MVEKRIVFVPLVWTFALNALPHPLKNLTVKLAIDSLTRGDEFLVDNALDVKKNDQHGLYIAVNLMCFFWPLWIWRLPLWQLLLSLRVITHVLSPVMILEMKLGSSLACCLGSLQTETRRAFWSSLNSLGTNLTEMHLTFKLSAIMSWNDPVWQSWYLTNIVDCLPMICKYSLANFCNVFQCCACRRSSRTLIVCPWSVCTIKKFCFGSWHYLWRLPVAFSGFLQQFF